MTFYTIVTTLYSKADEKNINLRPKLDIMLQISKDIGTIRSKFAATVHDFINETGRKKVLREVPANMKVNEVEARQVLDDFITVLKDGRKLERDSCMAIVLEIDVKYPKKYSNRIDKLFMQWKGKSITKERINYIKDLLKSQAQPYTSFTNSLNDAIIKLENEKTKFQITFFMPLCTLFDEVLKTKNRQKTGEIIEKMVSQTEAIGRQQLIFARRIKDVCAILKSYNVWRARLAENITEK